MVKPKACIRNSAPISDSGIATIGMSTERNEPRNRKMTTMTISSVSISVLHDLVQRVVDVLGGVVGDLDVQAGGQAALDLGHRPRARA